MINKIAAILQHLEDATLTYPAASCPWPDGVPGLGERAAITVPDQESSALCLQETTRLEISPAPTSPGDHSAGAPLVKAANTRMMIPYRTPGGRQGVINLSLAVSHLDWDAMEASPSQDYVHSWQTAKQQTDLPAASLHEFLHHGEAIINNILTDMLQGLRDPEPRPRLAPQGDSGQEMYQEQEGQMLLSRAATLRRTAELLADLLDAPPALAGPAQLTCDLGLSDDLGRFLPVLPRGTSFPQRRSRLLTIRRHPSRQVRIPVARRPMWDHPAYDVLDCLTLPVTRLPKEGSHHLEVIFSLDHTGTLTVTARDLDGDGQASLHIPPDKFHYTEAGMETVDISPLPTDSRNARLCPFDPGDEAWSCQTMTGCA